MHCSKIFQQSQTAKLTKVANMVATLLLADELHAPTDPNTMLAYVEMVFGNIVKDKVYY